MIRWTIDQAAMDELVSASRRDDPFHVFSQGPDDAAMQVSETLEGLHRSTREAFAHRLGGRRTRIDLTSATLLAHRGIDPLALLVLSSKVASACVMHPGDEEDDVYQAYVERASAGENGFGGFVRLSPQVVWQFDGRLTVEGLPDSAVASLRAGIRVAEVVRHPALDERLVATALSEEQFGERRYVHLQTSTTCVKAAAEELLALTPARAGGSAASHRLAA